MKRVGIEAVQEVVTLDKGGFGFGGDDLGYGGWEGAECGKWKEEEERRKAEGKVVATPLCRRVCGWVNRKPRVLPSAVETAVPGQGGHSGTSTERGGYKAQASSHTTGCGPQTDV